MTGYTRRQLIEAWDAIDRMDAYDSDLEAIKSVLPERPKQTMDEIGWNQDKHFLWEANYGRTHVAMLGFSYDDCTILTNKGRIAPRHLVPTGRRYKLVLDDHPEYLDTEQDYEDAPEGTVVELRPGGIPFIKHNSIWKSFTGASSSERMSGEPRRVLRWGWGTDA